MNPAPSTTSAAPRHRTTHAGMRALLGAFAVLTALATIALFVLAENTSETFAWTIEPPLTAAFIGAGYGAGFVLVGLSLRDPVWANSRVPVLTIFVFVVLTLVATVLHRDRMHFDDDFGGLDLLAKGAAWFWLAVYIVIPVAMAVLLVRQERTPGRTRRRAIRSPPCCACRWPWSRPCCWWSVRCSTPTRRRRSGSGRGR